MLNIEIDDNIWQQISFSETATIWKCKLTQRTSVSVLLSNDGHFFGYQDLYTPSSDTTKRIDHGELDANNLQEAASVLIAAVRKPIKQALH